MTTAGQRVHPLEALAEAMLDVVYRESRRGTERAWEQERVRLEALRKKARADLAPPKGGAG